MTHPEYYFDKRNRFEIISALDEDLCILFLINSKAPFYLSLIMIENQKSNKLNPIYNKVWPSIIDITRLFNMPKNS